MPRRVSPEVAAMTPEQRKARTKAAQAEAQRRRWARERAEAAWKPSYTFAADGSIITRTDTYEAMTPAQHRLQRTATPPMRPRNTDLGMA